MELYKSKPDDDYEDPKDAEAIKETQVYMKDFSLKTAWDYKIAHHIRINVTKKKEKLGQLDPVVLKENAHEQVNPLSPRPHSGCHQGNTVPGTRTEEPSVDSSPIQAYLYSPNPPDIPRKKSRKEISVWWWNSPSFKE